jgi:hypothetical protein
VVPYLPHIALMVVVLASLRAGPETVADSSRGIPRFSRPRFRGSRFRSVVAPMAPWVFAAPAIAFGLLPTVTGADQAHDGIALTAGITGLCALAGVLIQPTARRLSNGPGGNRASAVGLLAIAAGLALAAVTVVERQAWMLVPCSVVLGCAYGLCLVAGLVEVQRLADQRTLAAATAVFYALTYLGFAAPFLLTLATPLAGYPESLTAAAALALGTAALIARRSRRPEVPGQARERAR